MSKAFVFLNCDLGSEENVVDEMKGISGVSQAMSVSGIYDIVAELNSDSDKGISRIVRKMRLVANIRSCMTMVVVAERDGTLNTGK